MNLLCVFLCVCVCVCVFGRLCLFIHSFIHPFIHSLIHSLSYFSTVRSNRARDRCRNSYFWSFHSFSYSSTVRWIELGIGPIELGIDLRISNARRTFLARVSGLVIVISKMIVKGSWDL